MAVRPSIGNQLALEIDGQPAGLLRSFQPASVQVEVAQAGTGAGTRAPLRRGVRISRGEMAAEADLLEPGPLLDWLAAALAGNLAPHAGAVVQADVNFQQRRRIGFADARLTALSWPVLDASEARRPFTLALRWLAERVDDAPASGKLNAGVPGKRKPLLTSNFRVVGLPFGGEFVVRVELPSLSVAWLQAAIGERRDDFSGVALATLGELRLELAARSGDAVRAWVNKVIADGLLDDSEALNLQVELLDASMKKVQASFELLGCRFRGLDEDPMGQADAPGRLALRFAVDQFKPKLL